MLEEQAASRVHRIGQTREVTINRYIVENSIEQVCLCKTRPYTIGPSEDRTNHSIPSQTENQSHADS